MALKLSHRSFKDFIQVKITGSRTPGGEVTESIEIWQEIANLCRALGHDHILALMKLKGRLPLDSAYKIAKSADALGWEKHFKLAVVAPRDVVLLNIQFSEMVLVKMGYEVKMFSSRRLAKKWLLSDQSPQG